MTVDPAAAAARRTRLLRFAARLRHRHALRAALFGAALTALVLALPTLLSTMLVPALLPRVLVLLGVAATIAGVVHGLLAHRIGDAALFATDDGGPGLQGIGDELATWLELERRNAAAEPMPAWLSDRIAGEVQALAPEALAPVGRRRLGSVRWLVPVVLLVLLAWLLLVFLYPNWPGLLGGRPDAPGAAPPALAAGAGRPQAGAGAPSPSPLAGDRPPEASPRPARPQDSPPPPEPEAAEPPQPPMAPPPLLDLPQRQMFAVPEFLDDGPTRRMRAHVADAPTSGSRPNPAPQAADRNEDAAPPALPPAIDFERAAERAQAARNVPTAERAIVRRYFDLLREASK